MDLQAFFYALAIVILLLAAYVSFWVMVAILVTWTLYSGLSVMNDDELET